MQGGAGMKILPHFTEDDALKCSGSISLRHNMGALSEEDAQEISRYMESCAVINKWLSNIRDPITGRLTVPSKTWSDGEYVWDSSHIHYVKNYRVRVPTEFVDHVKRRVAMGFDVKALDQVALCEEFEVILKNVVKGDESYWASY
jgi:hypothetical protein